MAQPGDPSLGNSSTAKQPWYRRWWVWALAVVVVIAAIVGGDETTENPAGQDTPARTSERAPATATTPATQAASPVTAPPSTRQSPQAPSPTQATEWVDAPQDGTWDFGEVPFGGMFEVIGVHEYSFGIDKLPTMTTTDGGTTVTFASEIRVIRQVDRGFGETVAEGLSVFFMPGNTPDYDNEAYGKAEVTCEDEKIEQGASTTCTAIFTPRSPDEIENAYWLVNRERVGTWPSQK